MESEIVRQTSHISEFFEAHKGERHIIILQDYPDPDAAIPGPPLNGVLT
jgi:hypothetical protein